MLVRVRVRVCACACGHHGLGHQHQGARGARRAYACAHVCVSVCL